MVPVFVGDDVALRQRAGAGPEARPEFLEEVEIDVDQLVEGAVERAAGRGRGPAAARRRPGEEDRIGRLVGLAGRRERLAPVFLDRVDVAEDAAVVAFVGILARLAVGGERGALRAGHCAGFEDRPEIVRVAAEQRVGDQQDDADRPAATERDAATSAHAATVRDLAGIKLGTWVECHGQKPRALGLRLAS